MTIELPEVKISDDLLRDFLREGRWTSNGDDNVDGEALSADLIRRMVHGGSLDSPEGRGALGLVALALGVAQWGVSDPNGLPADPYGHEWRSQAFADHGKHLMSYGAGGIGISHADVADLREFVQKVISLGLVPQQYQADFLRTVDGSRFKEGSPRYDQIRVAGECSAVKYSNDLLEEPFNHRHTPSDCVRFENPNLSPKDWLVFRTWSRIGLRNAEVQRWLLDHWMTKYWAKTLAKLPSGPGQIEEAIINVRIRNSLPAAADQAFKVSAETIDAKLERQLSSYKKYDHNAYHRRCRIMLRPVVLWRYLSGEPELPSIPGCCSPTD